MNLSDPQIMALRMIVRPEYRWTGCPSHKVHHRSKDALIREGVIKASGSKSSGVRLMIAIDRRTVNRKLKEF